MMTGQELQQWRVKSGLSQAALAQRVRISPRTIQEMESRADPIRLDQQLAIDMASLQLAVEVRNFSVLTSGAKAAFDALHGLANFPATPATGVVPEAVTTVPKGRPIMGSRLPPPMDQLDLQAMQLLIVAMLARLGRPEASGVQELARSLHGQGVNLDARIAAIVGASYRASSSKRGTDPRDAGLNAVQREIVDRVRDQAEYLRMNKDEWDIPNIFSGAYMWLDAARGAGIPDDHEAVQRLKGHVDQFEKARGGA